MNSKTWLSGFVILCANAHYRASLFSSQFTLGFLSPPSNVGRCFCEPILCGNIIASKIGKAVMDLELMLSSTQRIEPSITGKLIMSPFVHFKPLKLKQRSPYTQKNCHKFGVGWLFREVAEGVPDEG